MRDPIIEHLVHIAELDPPVSPGVTVVVQGAVITGMPISRAKYMQLHPVTQVFQEAMDKIAERDGPFEDDGNRNFLNLENAKFFLNGEFIPTQEEGTVIRIKIEDIGALTMGTLGRGPHPDAHREEEDEAD